MSLYTYFLSNTITNENGCMIWQGSTTGKGRTGYAECHIDNRKIMIHRYIAIAKQFEDKNDPKILELYYTNRRLKPACHSCDNPPCINPEHVSIETASYNVQDAVDKGRLARPYGRKSGSIITTEMVNEIREEWPKVKAYTSQAKLARKYGISQQHVSQIINGTRRVYK